MREFFRRLRAAFRAFFLVMRTGDLELPKQLEPVGVPQFEPPESFRDPSADVTIPALYNHKFVIIRRDLDADSPSSLVYAGDEAKVAQEVIEDLRKEAAIWWSYKSGVSWDWGPR